MAKKITTDNEALAAVKKNGAALEQVPEKFKTEKLCLVAVQENGYALQYVPKKLQAQVKEALKKK